MSTPHYIAPLQLSDALEIKRQHGAAARFIAGGTDLILRMRDKVLTPELLIDVRHLSLDNLTMASTGLLLGAAVTHEQILRNEEVNSLFPALVEPDKSG